MCCSSAHNDAEMYLKRAHLNSGRQWQASVQYREYQLMNYELSGMIHDLTLQTGQHHKFHNIVNNVFTIY